MVSRTMFICPVGLVIIWTAFLLGQAVHADFDSETDFSRYRTYSWLKIDLPDSIWNERAERAIDRSLSAGGWSRSEADADAAVVVLGTTSMKMELSTFYSGMPGWGWSGWGPATVTAVPIERRGGTLVVDIYDTNTKKLIWRAAATDTVNDEPDQNIRKLEKAVEQMFKDFPPEHAAEKR